MKNEVLNAQKSSDERKARAPAKKTKLATNQRVEKSKVTVLKKASKSKKLKKSHVESDANNVVADRKLLNDYEPDLRESHLDILSVNKMVKDAVIDFHACFLLENELSNRSAFFFNTFFSDLAQRGEFHFGDHASAMAKSSVLIFPLNWVNVHWRLLAVINVLDDCKETEALFFDSNVSQFNPRH